MKAEALAAVKAYGNVPSAPKVDTASNGTGQGPDFGKMLAEAAGNVVETGKVAEANMDGIAKGTGDMIDVVTAVAETELAMETMVAVRDRVISAYQEIMNMPI